MIHIRSPVSIRVLTKPPTPRVPDRLLDVQSPASFLPRCPLSRPRALTRRIAFHQLLPSNNHLCNALSTQRLAPHETLALQTSNEIAYRCEEKDDGRSNQAGGIESQTEPLCKTHGTIYARPHVVGREASDKIVEGG